jgi:uncharacterized SAM-binding protein YcdF (DUF218 family)
VSWGWIRRKLLFVCGILVITILIPSATVKLWGPLLGHWLARAPHPAQADAIVVLGGGDPERIEHAMDLYRRGLAREVWHTGAMDNPADPQSDASYVLRVAAENGVPAAMTHVLTSTSTWEDAEAITALASQQKVHSLLIVTHWTHSRRALCVIEDQLAGTGIQVYYDPPPTPSYTPDNWWQTPSGFGNAFLELMKVGFYWVRYGLAPWRC